MNAWKLIGLAGVTGVASTAAVLIRRRRRSWVEPDPDQLRTRLHDRLAEAN